MKTVIFNGWEIGMKKISFYKMLKNNSHLTLKEAKSISNELLKGEVVEVLFKDQHTANFIYNESIKLGVKCKIGNGSD